MVHQTKKIPLYVVRIWVSQGWFFVADTHKGSLIKIRTEQNRITVYIKLLETTEIVVICWPRILLITVAYRNLFQIHSKSVLDWLMDWRLSDFDDIFILFMKIPRESCSWLGSKYLHKLVWTVLSSCMPHAIHAYLRYSLFKTTHLLIRRIYDFLSAHLDVNDPKDKIKFCLNSKFSDLFCELVSLPCDQSVL